MKRGILALLLVSCGGSTSPTSSGSPGDAGTVPPSDPKLDAVCDGVQGLTGRAVLTQVQQFPQQMAGTFQQFVYPQGPPAMDHPTPLTLRFRYDGGDVRCTPAQPDPPGTPNPGVTPAKVTLDVTVTWTTGDGLFDETFVAGFASTGGTVVFDGKVPVAQMKGSYAAIAAKDPAGASTDVTFFGQMYPDSVSYSYGGVVHGQAYGHFDMK